MFTTISTKLTKLFNVKSPVISAPMAYAATPALAAAVINAGGLGFLGAGNDPAAKLAEAIDEARAAVQENKRHLVSVGFVGWVLDKFNTTADPRLATVLEKQPAAVWFAFGDDLGKYVAQVHAHNASHGTKIVIFVNTNTVAEALRAANEWKADVIVVQGAEAGGRGSTESPPTKDFLKAVLDALPDGPIIAAAGGISTGAHIATMLTMGAAAVVLGTRFLFTHECMFTDEMKDILVKAGPGSTSRSPAYDVLFPPGVWGPGIEARCISNKVLTDFKDGISPADRKANIGSQAKDHLVVYAGVGVAEVNDIRSTGDVMKSLHDEAIATLSALGSNLLV